MPGRRIVLVDGADVAAPGDLSDLLSSRLRETGRAADTVDVHGWVRPASLRLEFGRTDELSYRTAWFDYEGLTREVIRSVRDRARWLPAMWDEVSDRSARMNYRDADTDHVLVIFGPMLLGRDLDSDMTVALTMTESTLRRRMSPGEHWTVPALVQHRASHDEQADLEVRMDHPDRPALLVER